MAAENNTEGNKWEQIREKLTNQYRLVIMNDETFEEVGSYRLTRMNVYLFASTVTVIVGILVFLLIWLTPLKKLLPGYGDIDAYEKLSSLNKDLNKLERKVDADSVYFHSVQAVLTGNFEYELAEIDELPEDETVIYDESILKTEPTEAEKELRKEVEQQKPIVNTKPTDTKKQPLSSLKLSHPIATIDQRYFTAPITGAISQGFSTKHPAIDVTAPKNTPIKAAMDGVVVFSESTYNSGSTLIIAHENNIMTVYKHNSELLKNVGDNIKLGEAIAIIGNSGELTNGPHLHFELWYNMKPIDPAGYIDFN